MRLLVSLTAATALLPGSAFAAWFPLTRLPRHNKSPSQPPAGCEFTLSSAEPFVCPAGQLQDGQIRLNGSYETASFFITNGGIIDSDGFGCIVTEAPITQFQCDAGKPPTPGFSIDAYNNLLYQGSPSFWACPATDYEYNIYIKPDFGQTKCFPITLKTSGCGAPPLAPTSVHPFTVWVTQTKTVTEDVTQTVTVLTTLPPTSCPVQGNHTSSSSRGPCKHCTKSEGLSILPSSSPSSSALVSPTSVAANESLSHTAISGRGLISKRDLYNDWVTVRDTTRRGAAETDLLKWVPIGAVKFYGPLIPGLRVATAYFHGCTVFVVVGSRGLFFGHMAQEMIGPNNRPCRALETRALTEEVLIPEIELSEGLSDHSFNEVSPPDCPTERYAIIMGSVPDNRLDQGPARLKEYFMDEDEGAGVPPENVRYTPYSSQTPGPDDPPGPFGKGLVTVDDDGVDDKGRQLVVLRVFMYSDTPRLTLRFLVEDGQFVAQPEIMVANSLTTTDGNKRYNRK
ncbi:hypothetical protein N656DRAFT_771117 [Canariomyces notabilis]|uniref:Cell wall mannoprotein PIR1-like C-terminal domain-containing protein n=1 Tax=Canariomyces notabilis TaxID=2074819 RepID=A0AAN6T9H0_9PEZI|nr:hypothetical protein N656DRAFT_771117 [Canariomyces arenarius]